MFRKILSLCIILLFLAPAFADGMIHGGQGSSWVPIREDSQQAIINLEGGRQNMLLLVGMGENVEGRSVVWVFPVPASPQQIKIDNLKGMPEFGGVSINSKFKQNLGALQLAMAGSVFPPLLLVLLFPPIGPVYSAMETRAAPSGANAVDRGYEIWQHIDKLGIATEVMTAWNMDKFYSYLSARGANISEEGKSILQEYSDKDYSFIVSWVSDYKEYSSQRLEGAAAGSGTVARFTIESPPERYYLYKPIGIFVSFPADKIYFPLRPTSIYKSQYIPITLKIAGFLDIRPFKNIERETTVDYYSAERYRYTISGEEAIKQVFNGRVPESVKYTQASIYVASDYLVEDLWVSGAPNILAYTVDFINLIWPLVAIIVFYLFSLAAMLVANLVVFRKRLGLQKLAFLALLNFVTIVGVIIGIAKLKKEELVKPKEGGALVRKILGIACFGAAMFALAIVFALLTLLLGTR